MDFNYDNFEDLHVTVVGRFLRALHEAPTPEWQKIAMMIPSGSGSNLMPFLKATGGMREWLGDAVFDQLGNERYAIPNRKFQKGLELERDQLVDDVLGAPGFYGQLAQVVAEACASHPDELVIGEALSNAETLLCYDGQPFFDTAHPTQEDYGDGETQSNLLSGGGDAWYLFDTSKAIKPLIYQVREPLRLDRQFDPANEVVFTEHKYRYNAWQRDAAGFGLWWLAVKSSATLDEAGFVAAREAMHGFHTGVKDELTGTYRKARSTPKLIMVGRSNEETARKLFGQEYLASGEKNYLQGAVEIMVSDYIA